MTFLMDRRAELSQTGYSILGGFADSMLMSKLIRRPAGMREGFTGIAANALCKLVPYTFPGDVLKKRKRPERCGTPYLIKRHSPSS